MNSKDKPVINGKPKSTEELNPKLHRQEVINKIRPNNTRELLQNLTPDYMPLLRSYKNIIEALDHNVNFLQLRIKILEKKVNFILFLVTVLYIFIILKSILF